MKHIIDGKRYDTETADWVAELRSVTCSVTDFGYWKADLHRTPRGRWFLAGKGGGMTMFAEYVGGGYRGGEGIIPISEREARERLEQGRHRQLHGDDYEDALERWFAIEEA
jgi:hypothetical protein